MEIFSAKNRSAADEYTWDQAVERWRKEKPALKRQDNLDSMFRWLGKRLDGMKLTDITQDVVARIKSERMDGYANATVNRHMQLLGAVLRAAHEEWGWIPSRPKVKLLHEDNGRVRWLRPGEMDALLSASPERLRNVILLLANTGLRLNNVMALRWEQIDFPNRVIRIGRDEMKTRKEMVCPMNDVATECLRSMPISSEYVFPGRGKDHACFPYLEWNEATRVAGIKDFRPHDLRHHWASMHIMNGTPLHVLKVLGGWSNIEMVMRYAHLSHEHVSSYAGNSSTATRETRVAL